MNDRYPTSDHVESVFAALASVRDIIDERPLGPEPPSWMEVRGWTSFFLALPDEHVVRCEAHGLPHCLGEMHNVPTSLSELAQTVSDLVRVPAWPHVQGKQPPQERLVAERKLAQIQTLVEHARHLASRSGRIVDFGCGRGHLTRLSSMSWDKPAIGLDIDEFLVCTAAELAAGTSATYVRCDARQENPDLQADDLAIGLHACGELGDLLVQLAGQVDARVLLVSCCPQKRADPTRAPLSLAASRHGLRFDRDVLGLGNLTHRPDCLAASMAEVQASRQRRYALGLLLRQRGHPERSIHPMRGLSRRFSYKDLRTLAQAALAQCGDVPPTPAELAQVEERAHREHSVLRRLVLARNMLARLLELAVVLDRASLLMESGYETHVVQGFDTHVSPRNLVLWAEPPGQPVVSR